MVRAICNNDLMITNITAKTNGGYDDDNPTIETHKIDEEFDTPDKTENKVVFSLTNIYSIQTV